MSDRDICKDDAVIARAQNMVEDFHLKFGVPAPFAPPQFPATWLRDLRIKLMAEELVETTDAMMTNDMAGVADGLADLMYVVLGTAVAYGIDMEPIFRAVHQANMRKVGGPTRADGKILKPKGWSPPDVEFLLSKQGFHK